MRLVSVVVPSYNHARYVAQALRSVIEQSYGAIELIVVDDGSVDGSDEVIRTAIADTRGWHIEYHRQANAGAHAAIMRGLSLARGDVLTILNSDDCFEPGRIARIMAAAPPSGDFIAFTRLRFIDEHGRTLAPNAPLQAWYDKALREAARCPTVGYALLRNNISVTSGNLVFSRTLFDKVGGFRSFRMCHDWDFLMRATHHVEPIYVQRTLMAYRYHPTNTLRSTRHLLEEEGIEALNAFVGLGMDEVPPNPLAPSWAHWPRFFDLFVDRFSCWFSEAPMGAYLRQRLVRDGGPPPGAAMWEDAARLGLSSREFLSDAAQARDCFALLREESLPQEGAP